MADQHEHAAPEPVSVHGHLASGMIEIIDTPAGERMRFTASEVLPNLDAEIVIHRDGEPEVLLAPVSNTAQFQSVSVPGEPHEFMVNYTCEMAIAQRHGRFACMSHTATILIS